MRHGGGDGVSVIAGDWLAAFADLGFETIAAAGSFGDACRADFSVEVPSLYSSTPWGENPPADRSALYDIVRAADLVVIENIASIPVAVEASILLEELTRGTATIVRHHDLPGNDPTWKTDKRFPLRFAHAVHTSLNEVHASRLRKQGVQVIVAHPTIDAAGLRSRFTRAASRNLLGLPQDSVVVVHPVIPYPHKRADLAARFSAALERVLGREVVFWLTGVSQEHRRAQPTLDAALDALGDRLKIGRCPDRAMLYAASDAVVMTSRWEGWGMPLVEAAAAGVLPIATPYPVLGEIHAAGVRTFTPDEVLANPALLTGAAADVLRANAAAAERFDHRTLPHLLECLISSARSNVSS